jgi:hypothetical protein
MRLSPLVILGKREVEFPLASFAIRAYDSSSMSDLAARRANRLIAALRGTLQDLVAFVERRDEGARLR